MKSRAYLAALLTMLMIVLLPVQADEAADAALRAQYAKISLATPKTAEAQWKLALWCEGHRLKEESKVHLAEVVRLDPKRDSAWKRLGYKKVDGLWLDEQGVAEAAETKKSIKQWGEKLAAIHKKVHVAKKQAEAKEALAAISDPLAVPAISREFSRGVKDQTIAVEMLTRIKGAASSKVLAFIAIDPASEEIRARAIKVLRTRDPKEYVEPVIDMIVDPMKFDVRPVGGPEAPGLLAIEAEKFIIRRFYTVPTPDLQFQPGDSLIIDPDGSERILRPNPGTTTIGAGAQIRTGRSFTMRDAQESVANSTLVTAEQMRKDIETLESLNAERTATRSQIIQVLSEATGKNPGTDRKVWKEWLASLKGQSRPSSKPKPTIDEIAPPVSDPNSFGSLVFLGGAGGGGGSAKAGKSGSQTAVT